MIKIQINKNYVLVQISRKGGDRYFVSSYSEIEVIIQAKGFKATLCYEVLLLVNVDVMFVANLL